MPGGERQVWPAAHGILPTVGGSWVLGIQVKPPSWTRLRVWFLLF